jgi:integrase/recombinase XerD
MAVQAMPTTTAIEKRNRALLAFLALTGVRDKALITLKLKHVDMTRELVIQDAREVETKFAKHIETTFFPVGDDLKEIVAEWVRYMQNDLRYPPDAPLFPRTRLGHDANNAFTSAGLEPLHWQTAAPVRELFRAAFALAGLPYFNPHSFRHMLVEVGYQVCKSPEDWKAWSQNLGHESVQTTYASYGELSAGRQAEVIRGLGNRRSDEDKFALILAELQRKREM